MTTCLYNVRIFIGDQCDIGWSLESVGPTEHAAIAVARRRLADAMPHLVVTGLFDGPGYARLVRVANAHDLRLAKFNPQSAKSGAVTP